MLTIGVLSLLLLLSFLAIAYLLGYLRGRLKR